MFRAISAKNWKNKNNKKTQQQDVKKSRKLLFNDEINSKIDFHFSYLVAKSVDVNSYLNNLVDASFSFKMHCMESAYLYLITVQIYLMSCFKTAV